jgi:hypothetical protein
VKTLYFELRETLPPPIPALRGDVQEWLREWEAERDADMPRVLEGMEEAMSYFSGFDRANQTRSEIVRGLTRNLQGDSDEREIERGVSTDEDPLYAYVPSDEYSDGGKFWYDEESIDETTMGCRLLWRSALAVKGRLKELDELLFWGVLGCIYEPFATGDPEALERQIESGRAHTLDLRVEAGLGDLLDYLNYFDARRDYDASMLEDTYEMFLAAVKQASAAECEALFSKLGRLEYSADDRPPRPAEAYLPIARQLWEIILTKPGVSRSLLGRGGLFYWVANTGSAGPSAALAALGQLCEGDCFEFWRVVPFLPFWAAARSATREGKVGPRSPLPEARAGGHRHVCAGPLDRER